MPSATLTSKGQITIPKAVRDVLKVRPGDRLAFRIRDDGSVVVEPETIDLMSLAGSMRPRVKGVTIEDMNEAIGRAAAGL